MLIIQYNARSLTKANLVQFKAHLHLYKPLVAIISETHWKNDFSVKFKKYHVAFKNRVDRPGGGVATLIHKFLKFSQIPLPYLETIEAIRVTIALKENAYSQFINILSVYVPNSNICSEVELTQLIQDRNGNTIVGGGGLQWQPWPMGDILQPSKSKRKSHRAPARKRKRHRISDLS